MELSRAPVCVFQNLMQRSAVPPPEASRLDWKGHHARAFTAAACAVILCRAGPPARHGLLHISSRFLGFTSHQDLSGHLS